MHRTAVPSLTSADRPSLQEGETEVFVQTKVGLYDGEERSEQFYDGRAYLTTHRIIWVDSADPRRKCVAVPLGIVKSVDIYNGFFSSHPKISIFFHPEDRIQDGSEAEEDFVKVDASSTPSNADGNKGFWTCMVCTFSENKWDDRIKCSMCGSPAPKTPAGSTAQSASWVCPACTLHNSSSSERCEVCGTLSPAAKRGSPSQSNPSPTPSSQSSNSTAGSAISTGISGEFSYIKLVFRGGSGHAVFHAKLNETLSKKLWLANKKSAAIKVSKPKADSEPRAGGIVGIIKNVEQGKKETQQAMSEAFKDLDALMSKASDMVSVAETIKAKLSKSSSEPSSEEEQFRSYLLSIGIASPVTRKSSGSQYHDELSRQLAEFLENVLPRRSGMLSLIDIYCLFNRARGTSLISPEDLYRACNLFESLRLPMVLRKFDSGVIIVQLASQTDEAIAKKMLSLFKSKGPLNSLDVSRLEGVSVVLATEQLKIAEMQGLLCRDDTAEGLRYYDNQIISFAQIV